MGKTLYLECYFGISGDMVVGALLDLGADQEALKEALCSLPVKGFEITISRAVKSGLDACDFDVILDKEHENHDHDMEYLYSEDSVLGTAHTHEHHEHRGLSDILDIIGQSGMTPRAKETASRIFMILGRAEAKAHGIPLEEVQFHEVGAVDSIVDIAAAAICLDMLDITEAIIPCLYEGKGWVRCQHGIIPIPAPAVSHIAAERGIPLHIVEEKGEFVTPTGAAVAAAIMTSERLPDRFIIRKIGLGAGKREYERPGILRAMLIEEVAECKKQQEMN